MMGLIVQHQDILQAHQFGHDPLQHLPFGFERIERLAAALQQRSAALRQLHALAELEGVIVGNDNLRPLQVAQHIAGHELAALIVAIGIVGLEHAQPVADGESR
jgi:hypothetical protein